ncbi:MAG: hypothetical protein JST11_12430 [Acidobacteria bacterium]|nr:hypothetical protein [Acidobacteriota bacterium]
MITATITRRVSMLAAFALIPSAFAASTTVTAEQLEMEKEGVQLIRQVEEVARDVRYNAGRLNSFTGSMQVSKWTHVHHVDQIKSLVNDGLRPALTRLEEIQPQLPDWKQQAIDRLIESAKALAADVNDAFLAKNEAGAVPPAMNAEYKRLVTKIYSHAEALVKTSDAAGTYAAARLKAHEAGIKVASE